MQQVLSGLHGQPDFGLFRLFYLDKLRHDVDFVFQFERYHTFNDTLCESVQYVQAFIMFSFEWAELEQEVVHQPGQNLSVLHHMYHSL